jgi:transposase
MSDILEYIPIHGENSNSDHRLGSQGSGFTWLFDEVMEFMKEMPVAAVTRKVGERDTRLWRVFHYYVERAMDQMDFSTTSRIAVDETSSRRRGHK